MVWPGVRPSECRQRPDSDPGATRRGRCPPLRPPLRPGCRRRRTLQCAGGGVLSELAALGNSDRGFATESLFISQFGRSRAQWRPFESLAARASRLQVP